MAKRLIDAEALKRSFEIEEFYHGAYNMLQFKEAYELINAAPTIEAKPVVHAHWEKPTCINGRAFSIYHCSACGEVPCGIDNNTKYCPNCGAQMDENHIAEVGKKEPICGHPQEGVKIPVISMEDVPKLAKEMD